MDIAITRRYYKTFSTASAAQAETWTDTNSNSTCDNGEPYTNANNNNTWDRDGGNAGQGGARDITVYNVTVNYAHMFPLWKFIGASGTQTLKATTVLANQPMVRRPRCRRDDEELLVRILNPLRRLSCLLHQIARDRSAIAIVEFAVALPFLLVTMLSLTELTNFTIVRMRVGQLALQVADNASRMDASPTGGTGNPQATETDINDLDRRGPAGEKSRYLYPRPRHSLQLEATANPILQEPSSSAAALPWRQILGFDLGRAGRYRTQRHGSPAGRHHA